MDAEHEGEEPGGEEEEEPGEVEADSAGLMHDAEILHRSIRRETENQ